MKAHSHTDGFSTIEILITFAVGIVFLTAAMLVAFSDPTLARQISLDSGQTAALDSALDSAALSTSTSNLGNIVASVQRNWYTPLVSASGFYTSTPVVTDISPCFKTVENATSWNTLGRSGRTITFGTGIANLTIAKGLGGDCDPFPIGESWAKPRVYSSHNLNPGKPVAIDVLNRFIYVTDDKGNLQIYNGSTDTLGNNNGFSITPYTDSASKVMNDVDVFKIGSSKYALITRHEATNQFQVINVTIPGSYTTSPLKTLGGATPPTGSFPEGWRAHYYDNRAYVSTRETAGREFHIFDMTSPLNPTELGSAFEVNGTINEMVVTGVVVNGHSYRLAFLATDRSANEIMVLNVTNPSAISLITTVDLPTDNDAYALQLIGNRLYVGRQKTSGGPELYVYNVTYSESGATPTVTLSAIGAGAEINADVTFLKVAGKFAFLGNSSPDEFRIWDISHPATGYTRIDTSPLNVSNKVLGVDYESPYLYVISLANDALQVLYSAP